MTAALALAPVAWADDAGRQAFETLLRDEARLAGQVDYDYRLGRAALDAGEPGKASLVFDRLLMVDPNHAGARLDRARAYYDLGDRERARQEFLALQAQNPPPAAAAVIGRYLAALDATGQGGRGLRVAGYAEVGYGRDSNVTVGPAQNSITLPVFGLTFSLPSEARARGDNFHQVGIGGEANLQLDSTRYVFAGTDLRLRNHYRIDSFDQLSGEVHGGLGVVSGDSLWRGYVSYNDLRLDDSRYRKITTVGGDWRHNLTPARQLSAFVQWSGVRYVQSELKFNDYDLYTLGLGWTRLPVDDRITLNSVGYLGKEAEINRRADGDKLFGGLRLGVSYGALPGVDLFAGAGWQYGRYERVNVLYGEKRRDQQVDLSVGAVWRFAPGWSARSQLSWTRNDSNTSINEYQRGEASVFVRRDF